MELSIADLELLEFARTPWRSAGRRDAMVLERFGLTPARYSQRLLWIIDQPGATVYDAQLVSRLRALQARRLTARTDPQAVAR